MTVSAILLLLVVVVLMTVLTVNGYILKSDNKLECNLHCPPDYACVLDCDDKLCLPKCLHILGGPCDSPCPLGLVCHKKCDENGNNCKRQCLPNPGHGGKKKEMHTFTFDQIL